MEGHPARRARSADDGRGMGAAGAAFRTPAGLGARSACEDRRHSRRGAPRSPDRRYRSDERRDCPRLPRRVRAVIFIDANVPMYLVGAAHPHKLEAARLLERAAAAGERLVTDVEVMQEILHRYVAIDRRAAIQDAFDALD